MTGINKELVSQLSCDFKDLPFDFLPWQHKEENFLKVSENISFSHPGWAKGQSFDNGGPWSLRVSKNTPHPRYVNTDSHRGPIWPEAITGAPQYSDTLPVSVPPSTLRGLGATAISRTLPSNPAFQLSQTLGEIMLEGKAFIPVPGRAQGNVAQRAGGEYLNQVFGTLPLISDIEALAHAIKHRNEITSRYLKNSDKKIRRRLTLSETTETSQITGIAAAPGLVTRNSGNGVCTTISSEKVWFSGAYRYHIPLGDSLVERLVRDEAIANQVLGTRVTLETLYNLIPFSWLTDYVSNTGDIITNISALGSDGLVLHYGYLMCHRRVESRYETMSGLLAGSSVIAVKETKQRVGASPYGFDLDLELTTRQQAVLVALGLTKMGRPYG
jgi:hypothetical protein